MTPGETTAHAIHAALGSFGAASPTDQAHHLADGHGHVIVLTSRNEGMLHAAYAAAQDKGFPCHLWHDDDRAGDGAIALAIGPVEGDAVKCITRKFQLM